MLNTYFYKNIENIQELTDYEYWESIFWTTYISDLLSHGNNHVSVAGTCVILVMKINMMFP